MIALAELIALTVAVGTGGYLASMGFGRAFAVCFALWAAAAVPFIAFH